MVAYGAAAAIASWNAYVAANAIGSLVAILALFGLMFGAAFLVLGVLTLSRRLGRAPLAAGAALGGAIALLYLTLPRLSIEVVGLSLAVALVSVAAMFER